MKGIGYSKTGSLAKFFAGISIFAGIPVPVNRNQNCDLENTVPVD